MSLNVDGNARKKLFQNLKVLMIMTQDVIHVLLMWYYAPINIYPWRGSGGDTLGIRQPNNPNTREFVRTPDTGVGF